MVWPRYLTKIGNCENKKLVLFLFALKINVNYSILLDSTNETVTALEKAYSKTLNTPIETKQINMGFYTIFVANSQARFPFRVVTGEGPP